MVREVRWLKEIGTRSMWNTPRTAGELWIGKNVLVTGTTHSENEGGSTLGDPSAENADKFTTFLKITSLNTASN